MCVQPCLTLWDPVDCSPPGFSVHGILQAKILERVAMPSSRGSSRPRPRFFPNCTTIILHSVQFSSVAQSCPTLCDPMKRSRQASLSITISWSLLRLMPIESVMPSNHLVLCHPLFLLPSINLSQHQGLLKWVCWFPLGWTGWISFQSKGLSKVFSNTIVQKHQFFGTQLSL